ncbi:Uncharacterised protein [uncultured archaeon]|nr:Uncharacterised protein [uncultured archaeon]
MRLLLAVILIGLFAAPAFAQPTELGGDYGKRWLDSNGNKNIIQEPSGGLWSWGVVPKGHYLSNGTLEPIGSSTIYLPSFAEDATPIVMNGTENLASYLPPDFSSPYFMDDPWFLSQITGRPVIVRQ